MRTVTLTRTMSSAQGTFGVVEYIVSRFNVKIYSGELPWKLNKKDVSCIPPGDYTCHWQWSPRLNRDCYHVMSVFNRSEIMIHPANSMGDEVLGYRSEVDGCIAMGKVLGEINGQRGILKSRDAVTAFEIDMAREDFLLVIRNSPTIVYG